MLQHSMINRITQSILYLSILCWSWISNIPPAQAQDSLCAEVKIEIAQELTLERQAFEAHMRIKNGIANLSLEELHVSVTITDEEGRRIAASPDSNAVGAAFFLRLDGTNGLEELQEDANQLDFTARVAPSSTADMYWLLIPAPGAAEGHPEGKRYYVGATLSYLLGGELQTVEVEPDDILVKPLPQLTLDYFLPPEVYGDDPWTPQIEDPVPFPLGVRVSNRGTGPAKRVEIESAQPRIVENKQGLLVDFLITGSEVNGAPASPSLLVNFGDIAPDSAGVAWWNMTASLRGYFEDFSASFVHADELGGELTSVIQQVETHYLIKDVLVDLPGRDTIRDFLGTLSTRPEHEGTCALYESDLPAPSDNAQGPESGLEVADLSESSTFTPKTGESLPTYTLAVSPVPMESPEEFWYLHHPISKALGEPGVVTARRSDGKVIPPENVWIVKSRTEDHDWDYSAHLFDGYDTSHPLGTLSYTLVFADVDLSENAPPVFGSGPVEYTIREGDSLTFLLEASDPDGIIPQLSSLELPAGATFTDLGDGRGEFHWTPAAGQVGAYLLSFMASDEEFSVKQQILVHVETDEVVTLTVELAGTGQGRVTDGGELECGALCSVSYPKYTQLSFTAQAAAGSAFAGAEGAACTDEGQCTLMLTENTTVVVSFNISDIVEPTPNPGVPAVPEPGTFLLLGLGLLALLGLKRRM